MKLIDYYSASYFDEISKDTGKYCFGIVDTISALEQGAVEKLIIWEHLDIKRYVFRNPNSEGNYKYAQRVMMTSKFSGGNKISATRSRKRPFIFC